MSPPACEICGLPRPLERDHDHAYAREHCDHDPDREMCADCFRGFLCRNCNSGIGFFGDDPKLLVLAVQYLEESQALTPSNAYRTPPRITPGHGHCTDCKVNTGYRGRCNLCRCVYINGQGRRCGNGHHGRLGGLCDYHEAQKGLANAA